MNDIGYIQRFFLFFQVTSFPPGKWRLSCAATTVHAARYSYRPEYLDQNPQEDLELVKQFSRKLTIRVFHSTRKRCKTEKTFWNERHMEIGHDNTEF